jgi:hypothetical protein
LLQFAQWLLSQKLAMASSGLAGYHSPGGAAVASAGMVPPTYMQQQVAGTTYFQPLMPGHHHHHHPGAGYGQQGVAAQHAGQAYAQQAAAAFAQQGMPVRMVTLGMPQPLRGRAPV